MIEEIKLMYKNMNEKEKYYTRVAFLSLGLLEASVFSCINLESLLEKTVTGLGFLMGTTSLVYAGKGRIDEDIKRLRKEIYEEQQKNERIPTSL
jgi:hypothetical protein